MPLGFSQMNFFEVSEHAGQKCDRKFAELTKLTDCIGIVSLAESFSLPDEAVSGDNKRGALGFKIAKNCRKIRLWVLQFQASVRHCCVILSCNRFEAIE